MAGEFWFTSNKAISCPACGAMECFESVWRPQSVIQEDPSGFLAVQRKTTYSHFDCRGCGHGYESRSEWMENTYPRGDGSPETLRERALWLGEQWHSDRQNPPQGRHVVGRLAVEGAFREALALFPDDHRLCLAYAKLGGENAPETWQRALGLASSLGPADWETRLGWATCLASLVRAQDGCDLMSRPISEYMPGPVDWITIFTSRSALAVAAHHAITDVLDELASPGTTVIVPSNPEEGAFVRPGAGPQEERILAMALCLAGAAAGRLSHDLVLSQAYMAKAVSFGPPRPGLLGLQSLEQGLLYQALGHNFLARPALENATRALQVTVPEWVLKPTVPPPGAKFGPLSGTFTCPYCHGSLGLSKWDGEPRVVRSREGLDQRAAQVWYLKELWYHCAECSRTWGDEEVVKVVETEF